jgi:hypothetical protein
MKLYNMLNNYGKLKAVIFEEGSKTWQWHAVTLNRVNIMQCTPSQIKIEIQ